MSQKEGVLTQSVNMEVQLEISNFLYREAHLLDIRNYHEWLDLLADDIVYRMPARLTNEGKHNTPNIDYDSKFFDETKLSLSTRVKRLDTSSAWAEVSGPRQRHFISNILIEKGIVYDGYEEYFVRSNFLYKRNRGSATTSEELFGGREDIIRRENGELKIASRIIYPDQVVLGTINLSMFL
ncbi:aromatic-ring-hydroxylating dioxygenase subunit beta [Alkalihalobacterium alkalinitrilicum]|uniref:aromatic-ring-hydroxylating dioxygenase subunit beta n=1 Tax=Alkalihalobacterium alkalinitrilicum TaxID=427920 RepID=UPI001EE4A7FA|nr:3-phenylpropionate/cinnamic acid dioxygenase subunit beta [Alkalihalobacterium alkalinitrilicum]